MSDFEKECLEAHNAYRKLHGVPPLELDKDICKMAQQYAEKLVKSKDLKHSSDSKYGENLYTMSSSDPNFTVSGKLAVDKWYEEIKKYTFGIEPKTFETGHFTQLIWKDTTKMGVGFAKNGGKAVVVANYHPPGNFVGQFVNNVPPVSGNSSKQAESKAAK